ncbi:MAG TPA: hypothetical protein EYN28_00725 [Flavobacteriales bacterium]|nr:hypothetical protein [Flavobacteriales bacterium]HIO58684.1 hypothetical protein [Flavobacteriales bacterium]
MSIPLNTLCLSDSSSTINDIAQARLWVNSFPRPSGFNPYAWNTTKRIALEIWKCYFANRSFERTVNFMHPSFYIMIRTPEGAPLLVERSIRGLN